jgi:hypothetical protein
MATAPQLVSNFPEITLTLKGIQVCPRLKLLRMSDTTFNFYVDGPERFVLHFTDPSVFGKEFAVLTMGSNSFTTVLTPPTKSTPCYVWSEAQIARIVTGQEEPRGPQPVPSPQAGVMEPLTRPIIIPPGM